MNILMLNWRDVDHPEAGGAEALTDGILRHLAKQGHQVTLFTSRPPNRPKISRPSPNYTIVRAGFSWSVHLLAIWYWYRHFRHRPFDIIIDQVHGLPFMASWYTNKPVVIFIHEVASSLWFLLVPPPISWLGYWLERRLLTNLRHQNFITVSPSTKQELVQLGLPAASITIIPEAITLPDQPSQPNKDSTPTLIYLGRLVAHKQIDDLLLMLKIISAEIPTTHLWLVGTGHPTYINHLRQTINKLNLSSKVTIWGHVKDNKKYELLSRAHLHVTASPKEGYGLTVIEAATQSTPTVAYDVPGLRDAIKHNLTGLLASPNTPSQLAHATLALLKNQPLYRRFQTAALRANQQTSFSPSTAVFTAALNQTLASRYLTRPRP